jgi:hypothetical protein
MAAGYLAKCAGKRKHDTEEQAEGHRNHLVRIGKYTMAGSNTYQCNVCRHWHVGRAAGTQFRGRARGTGYRKGRSHSHRKQTQVVVLWTT